MVDKKTLALITCYYQPNYGSQLQSYATQLIFDKMGVPNETIRIDGLKKEINEAKYKYFLKHIFDIHTVQDKFGFLQHAIAKKIKGKAFKEQMNERAKMFSQFSQEMFHLSSFYSSKKELSDSAKNYSAFVVGSDQLWLPSNIEADYFTLNFVPDGIPKIAFSTSFGVTKMPKAQKEKAITFLKRLNCISVREKSGQAIVVELTGKEVPVVCDPTLLFTAQEWQKIQKPERIVKEKYIFCYFLGNNPGQRIFAKRLRVETGLKIVQLQHLDKYIKSDNKFPDYAPYNIGPAEFISLIRDAEYVLTDSFHGTIFSLLHKKRFFSFRRYSKDTSVSTNSRLYSLLSSLHLESFLLNGYESIEFCLRKEIDYEAVHNIIAELRYYANNYLKNTLAKCEIKDDSDY
ncbi:hypothetical protein FACS189432_02400 [Bacteroidia bacterium]|nr:hypothetical protein FACS189426_00460 [Bacteroidia bacterium]GHT26951.1 hypothetical protein FACS189432_02400 [Bacteroidia bacterium]